MCIYIYTHTFRYYINDRNTLYIYKISHVYGKIEYLKKIVINFEILKPYKMWWQDYLATFGFVIHLSLDECCWQNVQTICDALSKFLNRSPHTVVNVVFMQMDLVFQTSPINSWIYDFFDFKYLYVFEGHVLCWPWWNIVKIFASL